MTSSSKNINKSGELFDLSVPTWNNKFGNEHIIYIMKYGINFPLEKIMDELDGILDSGEPPDDKSDKRLARQTFIYHCYESTELQNLFPLFCNYLNGCGSQSSRTCIFGQYENSPFVITVAGGNIITLFAQLITNIIDSFVKTVNKFNGFHDKYYKFWDMSSKWYEPAQFHQSSIKIIQFMFSKSFKHWHKNHFDIINKTFEILTPTVKMLLDNLENDSRYTKQQMAFLIASHFLFNDEDGSVERSLRFISEYPHSDFDFKLSPNIYPTLLYFNDKEEEERIYREEIEPLINKLNNSSEQEMTRRDPPTAGFLLLRAKTLISCNTGDSFKNYNSKQLKKFQNDCIENLGPWASSLFPQNMQQNYLDGIPPESDCWKFLDYLLKKKQIISDSTRDNIDETVKLNMSDHQKPDGSVSSYNNSTEALIHFLKYTTYNLNIYLEKWPVLSISAAPGKYYGEFPQKLLYKNNSSREQYETAYHSVCYSFLNLNNILYHNEGLISRISADIINYFLNNPLFQIERLLDNLILSINKKHIDSCFMPPSDVTLVPTNKVFSSALKSLKSLFNKSRYSELGYPDGLRITINAIETDYYYPPADDRPDINEDYAIDVATNDDEIMTEYTPLDSKKKSHTHKNGGGKLEKKHTRKNKKIKTKKNINRSKKLINAKKK